MPVPPQVVEPIGVDEPLGKNDEHTVLGSIWRHYETLSPLCLRMLRDTFGWKIQPIEDEQ